MSDATPTSIPTERARRFLKELAEAPFVALVFSADDVRVYSKGLDDETLQQVERLVQHINSPESDEDERTP